MKTLLLVVSIVLLTTACERRKHATPPPNVPNVAGFWEGQGTDDTVGYFKITMTLEQSGDVAFGTYRTLSAFAETSGKVRFELLAVNGGENIKDIVMERTAWSANACAATLTLRRPVATNGSSIGFYYSGKDCAQSDYNGGMTIAKSVQL